ncbi:MULTISPECIES: ABC-three component system protein [Sphingobacterium]|uniref:ABC-three component system protein n=1 Tax=Sphingobacterium TaxID=28453 RepID=UPI000E834294|nr:MULTISPECIES: ABC-three component system protein [Sphingobacterium]HAF36266.1 hypothetical protein [Sphingobacterium sp.]HBI86463.1 hypothetical protein [Sphingobacterium sp.]
MNNTSNLHSADGSILGFLYQIERAMMWLSSSDLDAYVGVEVDDDITVKLINGEDIKNIYEQAKHSQTSRIPYSDRSVDLWKTLSIWIEAVTAKKINIEHSIFSLLTNKSLPKSRLAIRIKNEMLANENNVKSKNESISKLAVELKDIASKLPKTVKPYGQVVIDCPTDLLIKIIDKITVLDNNYSHITKDIKTAIRNNLSISEDIPFDYIYQGLFGFVSDSLIMSWRNREPGWISVRAFNQQYTQLLTEFKRKSFFERTVDSLPVEPAEIARNRGKLYVEQLKKIGCSENEVIEAIHDFVRAASERSRFAQDGEISKKKFDLYFEDLINHWTSISRPKFRFAKADELIQVGYEVYYSSLLYKGKLNNYEPEQGYTHKGSYHFLADQVRLGWHPEWEVLKEKPEKK